MNELRTENSDVTPEPDAPSPTRRSFLHRTLATGAAAVPAALIASAPGVGEAGHIRPSFGRPYPSLYPGQNARFFREIQADENAHVSFLVNFLGGTIDQGGMARPKPAFKGLRVTTYRQFVDLSIAFENTGAGAYQGAAPIVFSREVLAAAASIGFVEAFHSGFLNTLGNHTLSADNTQPQTIVPTGGTPNNSFAPALTFEQVLARLLPYLADPQSVMSVVPLPTTTPSAQNDVAIANFALVAEYLEREFYNINVPVIFG